MCTYTHTVTKLMCIYTHTVKRAEGVKVVNKQRYVHHYRNKSRINQHMIIKIMEVINICCVCEVVLC